MLVTVALCSLWCQTRNTPNALTLPQSRTQLLCQNPWLWRLHFLHYCRKMGCKCFGIKSNFRIKLTLSCRELFARWTFSWSHQLITSEIKEHCGFNNWKGWGVRTHPFCLKQTDCKNRKCFCLVVCWRRFAFAHRILPVLQIVLLPSLNKNETLSERGSECLKYRLFTGRYDFSIPCYKNQTKFVKNKFVLTNLFRKKKKKKKQARKFIGNLTVFCDCCCCYIRWLSCIQICGCPSSNHKVNNS
jgi:hypothetical protein